MRILATAILILVLLAGSVVGEEYHIETGDLLLITVYDQDDLKTKARVTKGEVNFPLIGIVKAEGMTLDQLKREIEQRLEADYLVNPRVNVVVEEYQKRKVFVLGAVEKPGDIELPLNKPTTVLEAITMAGGFSKVADQNGTRVIRKSSDGKENSIRVKISDITKKGQKDKDIALQPNDVIFVPESFF